MDRLLRRSIIPVALLLALGVMGFSGSAFAGPTSFTSDDFNSRNLLRPLWTFIDPLGDATLKMNGYSTDSASVQITVPGGSTHDTYTQGYESPRIMQACTNTDFTIEVKYLGGMHGTSFVSYETMGILVEQDALNVMRFDLVTGHDVDSVKAYSACFQNGFSSPQVKIDNKYIFGYDVAPMWLRVSRTGNIWKMYYSKNGTTFTLVDSFAYSINVSKVGLSVGNAGPNPTSFTTKVDYFFNTDSPIVPEDGTPKTDNLSPLIYNVRYSVSPNTLLLYWKTDEPANALLDYGLTTAYGTQLGWSNYTYEHRAIVSGFDPLTTNHFKLTAADVLNNTGSTGDYQFTTGSYVDDKSLVSDDFNGTSLNTGLWTAVNPLSDATIGVSSGKLSIAVPGGTVHDVWSSSYTVPRVMQALQGDPNVFEFTVKFTSTFNGSSTSIPMQGIIAEQDTNNLLRANFSYDGTNLRLFIAGFLNGRSSPDILTNDILTGSRSPIWLRITQGGGRFRVWYSFDGNNFTFIPFFAYPLNVKRVGVFAGNVGSSPAAFTCLAEYAATTLPAKPNLTLPLNNALDVPTPVTLGWDTTASASTYRVQVATDAGFGSPVFNDSTITLTSKQVTGLLNTQKYYWRVRGKNSNGVGAYSDVFNFTTAIAAPAVPTPVQPANNAVDVEITPVFKWTKSATAVTYRLQVSTDTLFSAGLVVNDSTLTDTTRAATGLTNLTKYYWRVQAKNAGGPSAYSAVQSFTTISAVPLAPVQLTPPNGAVHQLLNVVLRWNKSNGATTYRLQVSTDGTFATGLVINDSTLTDTLKAMSGLANSTLYYWRVNAKNVAGTSPYSTTWSFTTIVANPSSPTLVSPVDGATNQDLTVTYVWQKVAGATSYRLQVGTDATFASGIVVNDSTVTDSTKSVGGLSYNKLYFWRVSAKNIGGYSPYSPVWSFRTYDADPSIPRQMMPADNATGLLPPVTIGWTRPSGATSFRLQVSTDSAFAGGFVINDPTLTDTVRVVSGLNYLSTYYWRVNADGISGTSPYSPRRKFTTGIPTASSPSLIFPGPDQSVYPADLKLFWHVSVPNVDRYWVDVALDQAFNFSLPPDSMVTDTTKTITGLENGKSYYWRVRAHNAGGWGPYSDVRKFTRDITAVDGRPDIPTEFQLAQNYPNPFNPATVIEFAVPTESRVTIEVYNLLGQRVVTLVDEVKSAGYHAVKFDASSLPSGLYLYRMSAGQTSFVNKMILMK